MNRTLLNHTLLNTSGVSLSRLNQSGLASLRGASGGISAAVRKAMVLWYDIERQGCTNESMAENPVLKDLSGNGHDATCYNFGWKGMSGIGGYGFPDLNTWVKNTSVIVDVITPNKVTLFESSGTSGIRQGFSKNTTLKLHISNIDTNSSVLIYRMHGGDVGDELLYTITEEGDYIIDFIYNPDDTYNMVLLSGLATFEQLPLYPNALVSDGVDDYCLVEGLPILTKENGYTVVARRKFINWDQGNTYALASKCPTGEGSEGAFIFEASISTSTLVIRSFGGRTEFSNSNLPDISWTTSQSYNGNSVIVGDASDYEEMVLFRHNTTSNGFYGQFALYSLLLFNRDLTAEEIEWAISNLIGAEN